MMRVRTMYARQRVFAGAPPTYVVAMLLQLSWLPIWLANLVGIEVPHTNDIRSTFAQIGSAYIVAASWGLARRASGRVAWGAAIAFIASSVTVAFQVYLIYLLDHRNGLDGIESTLRVVAWVFPICISVATVALAVAAGRGAMPVTIPMIALTFILIPIPPLRELLASNEVFFVARIGMDPARGLFTILSVAAIARQCREEHRDHVRGARGLNLLALLGGLYGLVAIVAAVLGASTILVQIYLLAIEGVLLVAIVWALHAIARAAHLSRYVLHAAIICVLFTLFARLHATLSVYGVFSGDLDWYHDGSRLTPDWWQEVEVPLAMLCVVGVLWRYSRDKIVLLCGAAGVTAVIASLFFIDYRATWVCTGVTCFALIPALVRTAKKLRADPVKTTADVFA
jgi:hypothetical protein